jgi:hypothetical protein
MAIKHNKFKNTGIIFEILIRKITSDTLGGKTSPAIDIIKKYFINTELNKEYKLYETLLKNKNITESKSEIFLNTLLSLSERINKDKLKKIKYNLIKEIKLHYNIDEFFKTKISEYKTQAAFSILLENHKSDSNINFNDLYNNKLTILEYLSGNKEKVKENEILEEFKNYDKDLRLLTYKILLEKFNSKYSNLDDNQKYILREFINNVDCSPKLVKMYNDKIKEAKQELSSLNDKIEDKVIKIKINEIMKFMVPSKKIKNDNIISLLQYYDLINEIKNINE